MDYIEVNFTIEPLNEGFSDILAAELAEIGFESFVEAENGLTAYVPVNEYKLNALSELEQNFASLFQLTFTTTHIADQNWNEEWEKNFTPVIVGNECLIKGTFHTDLPDAKYTITIDPKMSFGTGHHETTQLMIENILKFEFTDKKVLDMGCGTGVLAILATMRGASHVTAIDIEEVAFNNSIENIALNNVNYIKVYQGDASLITSNFFDVILANINKNVLLADISKYVKSLNPKGTLILSGIYITDLEDIISCAAKSGLTFIENNEKNRWVSAIFTLN